MDSDRASRVAWAESCLEAKAAAVAADPLRPTYHLAPRAGSCGDPNGPVYLGGRYHMSCQHGPGFRWGVPVPEWDGGDNGSANIGWGHASNADLVHCRHEPVALMPEPGSHDGNLCASGSAVLDDEGQPVIFYTAADPQSPCAARPADAQLREWIKDPGNPLIKAPAGVDDKAALAADSQAFRDPFLWREGDLWRLIVCSMIPGHGGAILRFQSTDLESRDYTGVMASGMGEHCIAWECPKFIPFGDKALLVVSPLFDNIGPNLRADVVHTIGDYKGDGEFAPVEGLPLEIGGHDYFYATQCLKAPDGRWLLRGMNLGGCSPDHPWTGNIPLPRVVRLTEEGRLAQEPARELEALREEHWKSDAPAVDGELAAGMSSATCEVVAELEPGSADVIALEVRGSDGFASSTRIAWDQSAGELEFAGRRTPFELWPGEEAFRLHVFVDRVVVEVFINGRLAGTFRAGQDASDAAIRLVTEGGPAALRAFDVWELHPGWEG